MALASSKMVDRTQEKQCRGLDITFWPLCWQQSSLRQMGTHIVGITPSKIFSLTCNLWHAAAVGISGTISSTCKEKGSF